MRGQSFTGTLGGGGQNVLTSTRRKKDDPFGSGTPVPKPSNATRLGTSFTGSMARPQPRAAGTDPSFNSVNLSNGRQQFGRLGERAGLQDVNTYNEAATASNKYADDQAALISTANKNASLYNNAVSPFRLETWRFNKPLRGSQFYNTQQNWRSDNKPIEELYTNYLSSLKGIDDSLLSSDTRDFRDTAQDYSPFEDYRTGNNMYQFQKSLINKLVDSGSMNTGWDWQGKDNAYSYRHQDGGLFGVPQADRTIAALPQFGIDAPLSVGLPTLNDAFLPDYSLAQRDGLRSQPVYDPWGGTIKNAQASNPYANAHGHAPAYQALQMFAPDAPFVQQGYAGRFSSAPEGGLAATPKTDPNAELAQSLRLDTKALPEQAVSRSLSGGQREAFGGTSFYDSVNIPFQTPIADALGTFPTTEPVQNVSKLRAAADFTAQDQKTLGAPKAYQVPQNYKTQYGKGEYYGGGTFYPSDIGNETDDSYWFKNYGWVPKSQVTPLY